MTEQNIQNQLILIRNIKDNIAMGKYEFFDGEFRYKTWLTAIQKLEGKPMSLNIFQEFQKLLDEADRQMVSCHREASASKSDVTKGWKLGRKK
jgi:hypothetical protein